MTVGAPLNFVKLSPSRKNPINTKYFLFTKALCYGSASANLVGKRNLATVVKTDKITAAVWAASNASAVSEAGMAFMAEGTMSAKSMALHNRQSGRVLRPISSLSLFAP